MRRWAAFLAVVLVASMTLGPVATAGEQNIDDRVHVSFVAGVIDGNGELWLMVGMFAPWDPKPPTDAFSLFFSVYTMIGSESSEIGWQTHAGVAEVLAAGAAAGNPKIFILDSGLILVGTGLFPGLPFTGTVDASFASWQDESTTSSISGSMMQDIDSASMETGNPFSIFGLAVYNLASTAMLGPGDAPNSPAAEATTTSTTTTASTSGAAESTTTSTLATSTSSGPTVTTGLPASVDDGGGLNFLVFLFLVLLLLGLLYWLIVFFFGWWMPPWGAPRRGDGYGDRVDDELGDGDDGEGGEDRDTQRDTKGDNDNDTGTDTGTDTTGSDDDDEAGDEEDPEEDRDTRPDCTELRAECERLKVEAAEAELDAQQAQASAENAQAACDRARQRAADAQARVTDLMGRADADQLYQRTAEAQIVLREAQTETATICDLVDPARSEAQAAGSRAAQAKAAADAACKAAEDCEAAAAN
ncbi:MAG: hypothetical protein IH941_04705 [Acidobacteria bacterium]|nr:hypothetical protein [Acidobacteriota bacterium]